VTEFGGPEVLHVVDLPDPTAGPGQLRIRVRAAAVNPTDTALRDGARADRLKDVPPPHVPGMDVAGVLEQIGQGVSTDLAVGDRVMAIVVPLGSHGAYSERVVVPAESVVRVPAGATDAEAATEVARGGWRLQPPGESGFGPRPRYPRLVMANGSVPGSCHTLRVA
jgi:NADPH:quinone reductase-like Zn-dependent oxidoreductase